MLKVPYVVSVTTLDFAMRTLRLDCSNDSVLSHEIDHTSFSNEHEKSSLYYDSDLNKDVLSGLEAFGHSVGKLLSKSIKIDGSSYAKSKS